MPYVPAALYPCAVVSSEAAKYVFVYMCIRMPLSVSLCVYVSLYRTLTSLPL